MAPTCNTHVTHMLRSKVRRVVNLKAVWATQNGPDRKELRLGAFG